MMEGGVKKRSGVDDVVDGGYCIGCGGCASVDKSLSIKKNNYGLFLPQGKVENTLAGDVCPFSASKDEDELGAELFSKQGFFRDENVGYYNGIYAGHVIDPKFRDAGGSSGFVTWLLSTLLERGVIDGVIHVKEGGGGEEFFEYGLSSTVGEILEGAKSRYHPAHFDKILKKIRGDGKCYAFVGVPCFVKAVRLVCENDEVIKSQVTVCVSLFCGHMKSAAYSDFLARQLSSSSDNVESVDFRVKDPAAPANKYKFEVIVGDGDKSKYSSSRRARNSSLYGVNWGLGYFKPKACEWCDDIVGELADISSGDAWLPEYVSDSGGSNIVVVRSDFIKSIIEEARREKKLNFDVRSSQDVYDSQAGNYRHRREGLGVRIKQADEIGVWHPKKRVKPNQYDVGDKRKRLYVHRQFISEKTHDVFFRSGGNPLLFSVKMLPDELRFHYLNGRFFKGSARSLQQFFILCCRKIRYAKFFKV
ncbi:Coenzyme F420 hydrogenase/dehydrogenase, beta subunit C-terminal domain [Halomonas sp. V046]|uniref:Coenzyme F420 hydrogenase/dehydrogenase, beta subunit C-terminal domain n=1 Tax=Halomonas sp. V046 TaxID=3459611 RepID=UPI004044F2F3